MRPPVSIRLRDKFIERKSGKQDYAALYSPPPAQVAPKPKGIIIYGVFAPTEFNNASSIAKEFKKMLSGSGREICEITSVEEARQFYYELNLRPSGKQDKIHGAFLEGLVFPHVFGERLSATNRYAGGLEILRIYRCIPVVARANLPYDIRLIAEKLNCRIVDENTDNKTLLEICERAWNNR